MYGQTKLEEISTFFSLKHISFGGIVDTHLHPKQMKFLSKRISNYTVFSSNLDTSKQILSSGGVSLFIENSLASHVQDFKSHSSRLLSVDLYFKGNIKLRIFVIYIPPPAESVLRTDTIDLLIQQLTLTKHAGFYHAVCGDFNMHLDKYYPIYFNQPQVASKHIHRLFFHLLSHGYEDYTPINLSDSLGTFHRNDHITRVDYVWSCPLLKGFALTACIFNAQDVCTSDHNPVITYYDMSLLFASTKLARARQLKRRTRRVFKFDSVTEIQWTEFADKADALCDVSPSTFSSWHINQMCEYLQSRILKAANATLPSSTVGNNYTPKVPKDLEILTQHYRFLNRLMHSIRLLRKYPLTYSAAHEHKWSIHLIRLQNILQLYKKVFTFVPTLPSSLSSCRQDDFKSLLDDLSNISKSLRGFHLLQEKEFQDSSIRAHLDDRNNNFETDLSSFIDSALSRTRRRITLDRVFVDHPTHPQLLTAPKDIDDAVVNHFQNFVPIKSTPPVSVDTLPDRWSSVYQPMDDVPSSIYDSLMNPPTLDEWLTTVSSTPNDTLPDRWSSAYQPMDDVSSSIYDSLMNPPTLDEWLTTVSSTPNGTHLISWKAYYDNLVGRRGPGRIPYWYKDIQQATTIPDTNNRLLAQFIATPTIDSSFYELAPCTSSPPTTKNWIVTLDDYGSPLFGKQLLVQASRGTCSIVHWISPDCESSPGDLIRLSPCPGCAAHTPLPPSKKRNADLTLCTPTVSLQHSLILPTTNERIRRNTSEVTSSFTWADIEDGVRLYYSRLDFDFDSPSDDIVEAFTPPITIESSAAAVFANSPLVVSSDSRYIFFTDGSLINLGTPDVSMGWSWMQIVPDAGFPNSIATYAHGLIRDNPSSSRAEAAAIYAVLTISPRDSEVTIYTDSQTAIDGLRSCSSSVYLNSRLYYKTSNFELWAIIERTILSKNLTVLPVKVKAHSGNYLNDFADSLANTAHTASSSILISGMDLASAHDFVLTYDNDIVCESNPRHLLKQYYQTQLMRDLLNLTRFHFISLLSSNTDYIVDWELTWFTLNFKPSHDASFTLEHASRHSTFKFKLFLDDLPTLEKLKRTRPDLYMDELTCRSCIDRMEDLMHLFMCKRRRLPMQQILQSYQNHLISKILDA
ncbi:hypothetical protein RhiirA5_374770, partial [Rhizophagus irregularis]